MKIPELDAINVLLNKFNENILQSDGIILLVSFKDQSFVLSNSFNVYTNSPELSNSINTIYDIFINKEYVKDFMVTTEKNLKDLLNVIKRFYDENNFYQFSSIEMLSANNPNIYHYDQDGNKVETTLSKDDLNSNNFKLVSLNYIK